MSTSFSDSFHFPKNSSMWFVQGGLRFLVRKELYGVMEERPTLGLGPHSLDRHLESFVLNKNNRNRAPF